MIGIHVISITFFMTFSINAIFYYFKEEFAPEKSILVFILAIKNNFTIKQLTAYCSL